MKNCKLKQLTLALGLALGGVGVMQSAQAVYISTDNLGQALIFPYYTVNGTWSSLFHVTNTSGRVVAVKARFRESYNSRDVMDFDIILSPYDVWTGWVAANTAGGAVGPALFTEDNTCTIGAIPGGGVPFPAAISYVSPYNDGGPTDRARMNEGYVEMIMMGASADVATYNGPGGTGPTGFAKEFPYAAAAIHGADGKPADCNLLVSAFQTPTLLTTLQDTFPNMLGGAWADARPLNILKGQYSLVNGPKGLNAVGLPTALANFRNVNNAANASLVTLQLETTEVVGGAVGSVPYASSWHEPSLFSSNTPGVYLTGFGAVPIVGPIATGGTAQNVSNALARSTVLNEWSRRTNAAEGWVTSTDWVVTFPTKNFYVDNQNSNPFAGRNGWRRNAAVAPAVASPAPFSQMFTNSAVSPAVLNGKSCDSIRFEIRNREEDLSTGAGFSPGASAQFCYEANVLTFEQTNLLNSQAPLNGSINNYPSDYLYGWLNVTLPTALPVVGFSIITRDDDSALLSEAGLTDHSYTR